MLRRPAHFSVLLAPFTKERMHEKMKEEARNRRKGSDSWGHEFEDGKQFRFPAPSEGMSIAVAYELFGFVVSDRITQKEINKRYKLLAKKYHPDSGGSPEQFKHLKEAQKVLSQVKHEAPAGSTGGDPNKEDVSSTGKRRGATTFTRANRADAMGTVDATNREGNPNANADVSDAVAFFIVFPAILVFWYWRNERNVLALSDSRSRMGVEEVRPQTEHPEAPSREWHPWRASNGEREQITAILEERKQRLHIENEEHPNYQETIFGAGGYKAKQRRRHGDNPFASPSSDGGEDNSFPSAAAGGGGDGAEKQPAARRNPYAPHKGAASVAFATPVPEPTRSGS
jgi:curved DNA-binding protein CbpA